MKRKTVSKQMAVEQAKRILQEVRALSLRIPVGSHGLEFTERVYERMICTFEQSSKSLQALQLDLGKSAKASQEREAEIENRLERSGLPRYAIIRNQEYRDASDQSIRARAMHSYIKDFIEYLHQKI